MRRLKLPLEMHYNRARKSSGKPDAKVPIALQTFLTLPVEIRRMISFYLVPDSREALPSIWRMYNLSTQSPGSLRQDGETITPGILRVNQQVYQEAIDLWYGLATFAVDVHSDHIYIFDQKISMPLHLPLVTRFLKSIHIRIHMRDCTIGNQNDSNPTVSGLRNQLEVQSVHLQRLEIVLMIEWAFYEIIRRAIEDDEDFTKTARHQLEFNLKPIIKFQDITV